MKGLDTPVLLAILHDSPSTKELLKHLRGEELATTELNLFELQTLAREGPRGQQEHRAGALDRLRRRITVLPISAGSVREAGRLRKGKRTTADYQALVWGTLAAAGCEEWLTSRPFAPPKGALPLEVRIV